MPAYQPSLIKSRRRELPTTSKDYLRDTPVILDRGRNGGKISNEKPNRSLKERLAPNRTPEDRL